MANRYILDPSGKIIVVSDTGTSIISKEEKNSALASAAEPRSINILSETKLTENANNTSYLKHLRLSDDDSVDPLNATHASPIFGLERDNNDVKYTINTEDYSFGFIDDGNSEKQQAFKSFNDYTVLDREGSDVRNSEVVPFADESEIMAGWRGDSSEFFEFEQIQFLLQYLVGVVITIVAVEAILALNEFPRNTNNLEEKFDLVLGEYTYNEYDIATKYLKNIVNYPEGVRYNYLDKITAYFIGLNEFLGHDAVLDIEKFAEDLSADTNFFDAINNNRMLIILKATTELTINSLTNQTTLKRLMLVVKKFNTQRYWVDNQLYTAKRKGSLSSMFDEINYYYFKFFIERVHVGLKILNRKFKNNPKNQIGENITAFNRLSSFKMNYDKNSLNSNEDTTSRLVNAIAQNFAKDKPTNRHLISLQNRIQTGETYEFNYKWDAKKILKKGRGLNLTALPQVFMLNKDFVANSIISKSPIVGSEETLQNFIKTNNRRAPIELVNLIEEELELEYVPFYFHDLRTNELISLHAFVESVSDSYSPDYVQTDGFGRIDSVRTYSKTTRSISMSFFIASLSPEDHELMWYQINKLVAMCYPQWSEGLKIEKNDFEFSYPFSQVITNSPLIRIRLGDVITSNYSRKNLGRIFGFGDNTPTQDISKFFEDNTTEYEYYLRPGLYQTHAESLLNSLDLVKTNYKLDYEMKIKDPDTLKNFEEDLRNGNEIKVPLDSQRNLYVDPTKIIRKKKIDYKFEKQQVVDNDKYKKFMRKKVEAEGAAPLNNPITGSYESGMSKGLAGHITNLDLSYQDMTWETSKVGSKAPMMAKISIQFAPIHDIPPGLDHNGMLRAANYNVGTLNNSMFGDPLDNTGIKEDKNFKDVVMQKYKK